MNLLQFLKPKPKVTIRWKNVTYNAKGPEKFLDSFEGLGKVFIDMDSSSIETSGALMSIASVELTATSINGFPVSSLDLEKKS